MLPVLLLLLPPDFATLGPKKANGHTFGICPKWPGRRVGGVMEGRPGCSTLEQRQLPLLTLPSANPSLPFRDLISSSPNCRVVQVWASTMLQIWVLLVEPGMMEILQYFDQLRQKLGTACIKGRHFFGICLISPNKQTNSASVQTKENPIYNHRHPGRQLIRNSLNRNQTINLGKRDRKKKEEKGKEKRLWLQFSSPYTRAVSKDLSFWCS